MLCSISGEVPVQPVASSKSGHVYERRLIVTYIEENHKEPGTGEDLEIEDLIDLKTARIVAPRPPAFTSIPSLLSIFQNEWDALALETFTLRQHLQQTRQELTTALYQQDAAVRVVARLTKERDEARDALSMVKINAESSNDDLMQIDDQGMSHELSQKIDSTQERLSKTRRKRPLPAEWADQETITKFETASVSEPLFSETSFLALDKSGQLAIVGGTEGIAGIYSITENKLQKSISLGSAITNAIWFGARPVISTSEGLVKILGSEEDTDEYSFTLHTGRVSGLALHPCGDILASFGTDKSFVFYDLSSKKCIRQVFTNSELLSGAFHPDGHLFAAGGLDNQIKMFHVKTFENAANFNLKAPVQDIEFSENGIWVCAVEMNTNRLIIFDLRKEGNAAEVKMLEAQGQVNAIRWDYTGQYLAASGPQGIRIFKYTKSSKSWSEVVTFDIHATAIAWGNEAKSIVTINTDGIVKVLK